MGDHRILIDDSIFDLSVLIDEHRRHDDSIFDHGSSLDDDISSNDTIDDRAFDLTTITDE